jgi:putative zinc finger/helix-turn-helix YgiT family protein
MASRARQPKPYPHRCPECGAREVYPAKVTHQAVFKHEGRLHEFDVPNVTLNRCRACGETIVTTAAMDQIADAFRSYAGLLTTPEILEGIGRLGLTQKEFADHLGVAAETVSRWIGRVQIQSRALDRLMRLFFRFPAVRDALAEAREGKAIA